MDGDSLRRAAPRQEQEAQLPTAADGPWRGVPGAWGNSIPRPCYVGHSYHVRPGTPRDAMPQRRHAAATPCRSDALVSGL
jgi:hypothetical protein